MKKKRKQCICMLGHKRIPSREGGIEVVVEKLATRMVQKGYEVVCYNRRGHHVSGAEYDEDVRSEYKGIKLKSVFTINKKGMAAVTSSLAATVCASFSRCQVVHFHAEGSCLLLPLAKLMGKRCIVTVHGLDHQRAKWGRFARFYIKTGERILVRFADEIIVLSRNVQKYFDETYGRKTEYIPNGVEKYEFCEASEIQAKWGLEKDNYILYLGRIVPEKGIQYLIEAFKGVKTDKKLVIAGGSSDTKDLVENLKVQAFQDERIIFTGFVKERVLSELYSNAYLYVLPSDLEGMPLSLLEALSYGNCCLVSDIPECSEVVENQAVIFKAGNIKDLQKKLQKCCDNPEWIEAYRQDASSFVCSKYNWDDIVDKTLVLYGIDER